mgnify:CR=1 FL=1
MPRDISDVYCQPWSGCGGPAGRPVGPVRGPRRVRQRQQGRAALGHEGNLILLDKKIPYCSRFNARYYADYRQNTMQSSFRYEG